uniref:Uncharacterized protein n=1 Tax=Pundamilia nyererei TaxID=303518 RepID=A0A3B4GID9_9CICH
MQYFAGSSRRTGCIYFTEGGQEQACVRGLFPCFLGLLSCLFLAGLYVGSLYVWRSSSPRDHPSVIKRRCASVLLVSVVSPAVVKTWIHWADVKVSIL